MLRNFGNEDASGHGDVETKHDPDFDITATYRSLTAVVNPMTAQTRETPIAKNELSLGHFVQSLLPPVTSPPPLLPSYFFRHTSFASNSAPVEIMKSITDALLSDDHVDFEQVNDYEVMGIAFRSGYSVDFLVRIYSCSTNLPEWKFLIEVQRQFGDHAAFLSFYEDTFKLVQPTLDVYELVQKSSNAGRLLSPPLLDDEEPGLRCIDYVQPLLDMAQSEFLETQREGLRGLIVTPASPKWNDEVLRQVKAPLLNVIDNALTNRDWEVRRCGATVLAQVSEVEQFHGELIPLLTKIIPLLQSSDLKMAETRRQLATVLVKLAATHVDIVRQYSPLLQYNCKQCSDGRLRSQLISALDVISVS